MSIERLLTLPVVMFRHQEQCFAIEAAYVRSQGCALANEDEMDIRLFAALIDRTAKAYPAATQYLQLADLSGSWRMGLETPAELIELAVTSIYALPPLLQARRQFLALHALAWYQGELVSLLDARALQQLAIT